MGPRDIDRVLGLTKAYVSQVGTGPFPSELSDEIGETMVRVDGSTAPSPGAADGCGWLDAVALRYAVPCRRHHRIGSDESSMCSPSSPPSASPTPTVGGCHVSRVSPPIRRALSLLAGVRGPQGMEHRHLGSTPVGGPPRDQPRRRRARRRTRWGSDPLDLCRSHSAPPRLGSYDRALLTPRDGGDLVRGTPS